MELKTFEIEFKKDDNNNEFAIITVNTDYVINKKGKLSKDKYAPGAIYPKVDGDGVERNILYRCALLLSLLKADKIEFDL
jgi:hypothetical protein